jgi:uncharacterized protein
MLEPLPRLLLGLLTGLLFGFLLQKGQVAKFDVIVRQLLFRDSTVFKIMLTAVMVGAVGIYLLLGLNAINLSVKPADFAALLIGAAFFGAGMALFGYCPGTSVAASGAGHKDAAVGVIGMVAGAFVYIGLYDHLRPLSLSLGSLGKVTLPQLTQTPPWIWVAALCLAGLMSLYLLERYKNRKTSDDPKRSRALVGSNKT